MMTDTSVPPAGLDAARLLAVVRAVNKGDFSVRLAHEVDGLDALLAAALSEGGDA